MKYKVGDKVRIRANLRAGTHYPVEDSTSFKYPMARYCNGDMKEFAGSVMTVANAKKKDGKWVYYQLTEDNGLWEWAAGMFEGLAEEPAPEPHEDWSWEDLF